MATPAEQAGRLVTCPFQADCRNFVEEHTTVSPEVAVDNARTATQRFVAESLSGRLFEGMWSGEAYKSAAAAAREASEAVTRSLVSGKVVEPPKSVSRIDSEGVVVQELADSCVRCHGSTAPVFFKPGEECDLARLAHRALFNGVPLQLFVERLQADPAAKVNPSE